MKPRRHFKETDVKILRKTIARDSAKLSNLSLKTLDNIDQYFEILTDIINKSIAVSTPLQKITTRSKLGFNLECKVVQMRGCQLRKRFNQLGSDSAWEDYRLARLEEKYIIRKASQKAFREL